MEIIIAQPLASPLPSFTVRKGGRYKTAVYSDAWMRGARFVTCTSVRSRVVFFRHDESKTRFKVSIDSLSDFVSGLG